jgi:hypothetical protein
MTKLVLIQIEPLRHSIRPWGTWMCNARIDSVRVIICFITVLLAGQQLMVAFYINFQITENMITCKSKSILKHEAVHWFAICGSNDSRSTEAVYISCLQCSFRVHVWMNSTITDKFNDCASYFLMHYYILGGFLGNFIVAKIDCRFRSTQPLIEGVVEFSLPFLGKWEKLKILMFVVASLYIDLRDRRHGNDTVSAPRS